MSSNASFERKYSIILKNYPVNISCHASFEGKYSMNFNYSIDMKVQVEFGQLFEALFGQFFRWVVIAHFKAISTLIFKPFQCTLK